MELGIGFAFVGRQYPLDGDLRGVAFQVVEYALRGTTTPMGIAEFTHLMKLPDEFKASLLTIEELEAELGAGGGAVS